MNILMPITNFMTKSLNNSGFGSCLFSYNTSIVFLLASFLSLLTSCEEDPTNIGKGLLPGSDFVNIEVIDTIKPASVTMYDAAVPASMPQIGYTGELRDPYFGTTRADIVTQLRLKDAWQAEAVTIDSIILYMELNVNGTPGGIHTINFSEISEQLSTDSVYYSNKEVPLTGDYNLAVQLPQLAFDSINEVAIKLPDNSFAERLFRDTSMLFHSNVTPDFRSYLKGFQISVSSIGEPVLLSMNLANDATPGSFLVDKYYKNFFAVFYHNEQGQNKIYYVIIDATNRNASFNRFEHIFSTADPDKVITGYNDPDVRSELTYVQSLNGLYTRILLTGLETLKNSGNFSNIAVNKAQLTLPFYTDNDIYSAAKAPSILLVRYRTNSGAKPIVHDYSIDEFHEFYNGRKDTINKVYRFNLATFVQEYLNDETGTIRPELEVIQGSGISNLILRGNGSSSPILFDFTYTRF